ncbi:MAG: hypothetical protein NC212_03050 [Staphylococcus sp.]|nr:hypothetical protein [Staphylococcus sp.]
MMNLKSTTILTLILSLGLLCSLGSCGSIYGHWGIESDYEIPAGESHHHHHKHKPKKYKKHKRHKHRDDDSVWLEDGFLDFPT